MKALLVIDVQKSYMLKYETDLLDRINRKIEEAKKNQCDIVYIKNTKLLRSGAVTDEFAEELFIASDNVFCKEQANAFSSEALISYLNSKGVSEIEMIGVDGNSCINASAKGAVKSGFFVSVNLDCVGVSNFSRFEEVKENLKKLGIILK